MTSGKYRTGSVTDPMGPSSGFNRVGRGGSWDFSADYARAALRFRFSPDDRFNFLGFRLALPPGQ